MAGIVAGKRRGAKATMVGVVGVVGEWRWAAYMFRLRPPSTLMIWPVTRGASHISQAIAAAISDGLPVRASGVLSRMAFWYSGSIPTSPFGQRMAPGDTPFTRTSGARSFAQERVRAARPALLAQYSGWFLSGFSL